MAFLQLTHTNGAIPQSLSATTIDPNRRPAAQHDNDTRCKHFLRVQIPRCNLPLIRPHANLSDAPHGTQYADSIVSILPSTVPETMDCAVMEEVNGTASIPVESVPQADDARHTQFSDATQPISQSVYDDVIRSRSELASLNLDHKSQAAKTESDKIDDELQHSVQEGDPNFLDICSSFLAAPAEADSLPINFSPTQTQRPHTQFPESQRFKTPATAGRKRDRTGNVIDTPIESRNPFARKGNTTPGNVVGLSQAFANTQAASSPFPVLPTSELRSDKPSPGIEVQHQVRNPTTSSPLRPLTDPRRPSQPASKYVPAGHSQLLRLNLKDGLDSTGETQESVADEFNSVLSIVERKRRAREREDRARKELEAASSPVLSEEHHPVRIGMMVEGAESENFSGTKSRTRSRSLPSSPPIMESEELAEPEFQDTQNNGSASIPVNSVLAKKASRVSRNELDDSRKNEATVIPDTTKRLTRSETRPRHLIQPSPSECRTRRGRSTATLDPVSSNLIRVVNTQRSNTSTQEASSKLGTPGTAESIDVIPASPEGHLQSTEPSAMPQEISRKRQQDSIWNPPDPSPEHRRSSSLNSSPADIALNTIIPETSSDPLTQYQQKASTYVTAITNRPSASSAPVSEWGSQPVRTTPPGRRRKRKRLGELSQEEPALVASQSSAFDPAEALALDPRPEIAMALSSSQETDPIQLRKRIRRDPVHEISNRDTAETALDREATSTNDMRGLHPENIASGDDQQDIEISVPSSSLTELTESPVAAGTPPKKPAPKSIWSPGNTPQPHSMLPSFKTRARLGQSSLQNATAGRNKRTISRTRLRTPKPIASTLASIREASPDPLTVSRSSTAERTPGPPLNQVIAPQMIFALYMRNTRLYYPAICHGYSSETQSYAIKWPGYDPEQMARSGICSLDLRIGDEVKVERKNWPKGPWKIRDFGLIEKGQPGEDVVLDIYGHSSVKLELKNPRSSLPKDVHKDGLVPLTDIYIDSNQWRRVSKRPFAYMDVNPVPRTLMNTSRPSTPMHRPLTPSTPSSRGRNSVKDASIQPASRDGILSNMGFALSFEEEAMRRKMTEIVQSNGGTIIQPTFKELVTGDMQLKSNFRNLTFAALLADRHSRKEKYMQALAFGLPCLSGKWAEISVKRQSLVDWRDYLLPAGESRELDGAVRSRVLPPIEMAGNNLSSMFDKRPRFFTGTNVIFVTGRPKLEKHKPHLFFVQIMSAAKVEEVVDLAAARLRLEEMEKGCTAWIIVNNKESENAHRMVQAFEEENASKNQRGETDGMVRHRVVDTEFVMQSLILGRLCE